MTTATLTTETLTAAINKSHAKTISELWRFLGHKSAISGSQSKKIRELVPTADALLAANKAGKPVQVVAAAKAPTTNVTKGTKIGGYRAGSDYATIYAEGNKGFTDVDAFITHVAKVLGKAEKLVRYSYYVVAPKKIDAKSPSNRGTHLVNENGTLRIVQNEPVKA